MEVIQKKRVRHVAPKLRRPKKTKTSRTKTSCVQQHNPIQCCYINHTEQFQIVRIPNATSNFFERVVMPYARIIFEAHHADHLEIHTGNLISSILSDKIPCHRLAFQEDYPR
ncbi:DUF1830 domain-containing protein [Leptolyngbya cf. ectocarpi LEGE 11479]|uniref:DUF1830 domain-containing protein n=1 Tax=Leptolyngbya cf. ectocarpi LEGE 11479 TaxID=1828722 RepID=A0A928X1L2_LEPEC|nr:DUF1830 domain-containing protein [Leptolyngbya ectocarpi]MBE9067237.1 DUF1830 domain-containing protein [Leptolyngbya cf. ectocarpi LEGE 11479]